MTKRYSGGDGSERPSVTIRWEPDVLSAASLAATVTNTSLNSFINTAVAGYLQTPEVSAELVRAATIAQAAINKLAGRTD